jgi:hypothetical protein
MVSGVGPITAPHLGSGDRRCLTLPHHQARDQLFAASAELNETQADEVMRMPRSKQRNKHIQRALVEAAKLAPRQSHEMAMVYDREKQTGNGNRGHLP